MLFRSERCQGIEEALAIEQKTIKDASTEMHSLQRTIDIRDPAQLQRATSLLTIAQVGNERRAYRHQEHQAALQELTAASVEFVKTHFYPRCQQLEARARAKVSDKLKKLFPDEGARQSALVHSPELVALAAIQRGAVVSDYSSDGAIRQSKLLLDGEAAADAFETQHLT